MKHLSLSILVLVIVTGCTNVRVEHTAVSNPPNAPVQESTTPTATLFVAPTIIVTPYPKYVGVSVPEPGKSYTVDEYKALAPSLGWNATLPGICISIWPWSLLETGDFPTTEEWLARMYLVIDDQVISEYHSLLMTKSEGRWGFAPETKEKLWQEPPGSPLCVCYATSLDIGVHTATITIKKTSGSEVSHSWQFAITE